MEDVVFRVHRDLGTVVMGEFARWNNHSTIELPSYHLGVGQLWLDTHFDMWRLPQMPSLNMTLWELAFWE